MSEEENQPEETETPQEEPSQEDVAPEDASEQTAGEETPDEPAQEDSGDQSEQAGSEENSDNQSDNSQEDNAQGVEIQEDVETSLPDAEAYANLEAMGDVDLEFNAILGKVEMTMDQYLKLGRGAIVELNQNKDDLLDIEVNGHYIGKADITTAEEQVAVIISEIGKQQIPAVGGDDDMAAMMGGDDDMAAMMAAGDDDMAAAMGGGDDEADMAAAMEGMDGE